MISIAMTYYNRRQHLINTLHSFTKSEYKNIEVIVVDDASDDEHRIEDLMDDFDFLKVIRIDKEDKKHVNPCVPFNIALSHTTGDIIILQNPECFHYGDVLSHAAENAEKNKYLAYTVVNKDLVNELSQIDWNENFSFEKNKRVPMIHINEREGNLWYCHSQFRPEALNFCTAITRDDLVELNGFDERYANGVERDDVEFLERIKKKGMQIVFIDSVLVIHQTHPPFSYTQKNAELLRKNNHALFARTTACETTIKVNPDKEIIKLNNHNMKFTHLIISRVNIKWKEHSKDEAWLEDRIKLLNRTLRASLKGQTNQNFKFISLWGYEPVDCLPNEYAFQFESNNLKQIFDELCVKLADLIDEEHVLITRIDSDNSLGENFVEVLHNGVRDMETPHYYDISKMHMYDMHFKNKTVWTGGKTSGFISIMEKADEVKCLPYRYSHGVIGDVMKGRVIDELDVLLNIHENNVSAKLLGSPQNFDLKKFNLL